MASTPAAAFDTLMKGVTAWDLPKGPIPSELLLTGEDAFPVMVNGEGHVLMAASSYGAGRLLVLSHEGYLLHDALAPFLLNALGWLRPSPEAPVAVHPSLAPLVNILRASGVEAQSQPEPGEPLGVYCTSTSTDASPEQLVQFVKHGGGLLIGGQAWNWARQHGCDKVLSAFPGNQVTGVAGVYFTGLSGESDQFEVSKEIPEMPIYVGLEEALKEDQRQLLEGISEFDIRRTEVPSQLLVHGELAFGLGIDSSMNCFIAAAHYGRGRVVLTGHESLILNEKMAPFVVNALHWLAGKQTGKIGLDSKMEALGPLLSKHSLDWAEAELSSDLSVFCCGSLANVEAKKVKDFVTEGGGLLIGMQAWQWGRRNPGSNCMSQYPDNKILQCFGLGVIDKAAIKGHFPVPNPGAENYHIRLALSRVEITVYCKGSNLEESWQQKLLKDCSYMFQIPAMDIPIYESMRKCVIKMIKGNGLPRVDTNHPILKGSLEALLISLAQELVKSGTTSSVFLQNPPFLPATRSPITIDISRDKSNSWVSTGLYLPEGQVAEVTLPNNAVAAKLKILIGCHTDTLKDGSSYFRPPVVTRKYKLDKAWQSISWLYGGLLYILVPYSFNLDVVPVTISGAALAPYFRLGKTSQAEWKSFFQGRPAPWGELATDNIILTVPTENLKGLNNPTPLLRLWDDMMQAIARLAAKPFPFRRPERIVTDVQVSFGLMHAGYPIRGLLQVMQNLINEKSIRKGAWAPLHELGHNQQRNVWEFPPHTTEATCNLWAVYVHETVLGIPRARAHPALRPPEREKRIREHLQKGAPLSGWEAWTALETYLQLQEAFGWEPFIQLFAEYQTLSGVPHDNTGKMNLWVKKFSEKVQKNLVPFFQAWGWPIRKEVAAGLASLPTWQENPMKSYGKSN